MKLNLISNNNHKIMKSILNDTKDRLYYSLMLAPASTSGFNICPSSGECEKFCVSFTGHGGIPSVTQARVRKTLLFIHERDKFFDLLEKDLCKISEHAHKQKKQLVVRLNTFSDLAFERIAKNLFEYWNNILFLDYTKRQERVRRYSAGDWPKNYFLAYSHNEKSGNFSLKALSAGIPVSFVVRRPKHIPLSIAGYSVTDADFSDSWIIDSQSDWEKQTGTIGILKAKGKLISSQSAFVLNSFEEIEKVLTANELTHAV